MLSEEVKLYIYLPTSKRYCALNDKTINMLMEGDIDVSAVVGQETVFNTISGAELVDITAQEKEVEMSIVDKHRTRAGGSVFPYLNITIFDLSKYGILNLLINIIINIIAYILLYKQVAYQISTYNSQYYI